MTENDAEILAKDSDDMRAEELAGQFIKEYEEDDEGFKYPESTDEASD